MRKFLVRAGMGLISAFVVVVIGFAVAQDYTKARTFTHMRDIWSLIKLYPDAPGVFTEVDSRDYVQPPYPEPGDTLLTINGLPATVDNYFSVFSPGTSAGEIVAISYSHEGGIFATRVVTRSIPSKIRLLIVPLFALRFLIAVALVAVGLWAYVKRPYARAARVLSLFCYSLAGIMMYSFSAVASAYATIHLPGEEEILRVLGALSLMAAPLWLNLMFLFPREKPWYMRRRALFDILCYAPAAAAFVISLLADHMGAGSQAVSLTVVAYFATAFTVLVRSMHRSDILMEKRQMRLVLWGSLPSMLIMGLLVAISRIILQPLSFMAQLAILNALFLCTLAVPLTFAYAIGRYRLLEVEARVRRGTLFVIVNAVLLALLLGLVYKAGGWLMRITGAEGPAPVLVMAIGLAAGFAPAQRGLRNYMEDRFFPERRRLRDLLRDFLATTRDITDGSEFWRLLRERLSDGLQTSRIEPVLFPGQDSSSPAVADDGPAPFTRSDELLQRLAGLGRPMLVDEIVCCGRLDLTPGQIEWLNSRHAALILPLVSHSGLRGFVLAGQKNSGEDYTSSEIEILHSLSAQIGIAAENIELLREKVEKERLQEQLQIARRIQKSLLPLVVPEVPGLELAARIRFCLDVAGDFYDFVPLPDGRVIITVGDVSGKGVGPALLMANLQASMRAVSGVGLELPDIISRVNRLVYDATPSEYFITLFTALYEPKGSMLSWVNAGHNPPMLLRADGTTEMLDEGGLLLGVAPGASYGGGRTVVNPGDLLVMYTDGVSEAMNASEEEFGVGRIAAVVDRARRLPLDEMLQGMEEEVRRFSGTDSFADDFTIVAARGTGPAGREVLR